MFKFFRHPQHNKLDRIASGAYRKETTIMDEQHAIANKAVSRRVRHSKRNSDRNKPARDAIRFLLGLLVGASVRIGHDVILRGTSVDFISLVVTAMLTIGVMLGEWQERLERLRKMPPALQFLSGFAVGFLAQDAKDFFAES